MLFSSVLFRSLLVGVLFFYWTTASHAISCESGQEPVLKIKYKASDHLPCLDPKKHGFLASTPWGIDRKVLYQTRNKKKKELFGECVLGGFPIKKNGEPTFTNEPLHRILIRTEKQAYQVNVIKKNGSVRFISGKDSTTHEDFEISLMYDDLDSLFDMPKIPETMQVLPGYSCTFLPPMIGDPVDMRLCVAEIDTIRAVLYSERNSISSNDPEQDKDWYKAESVEWICAGPELFEPPSGIKLKRLGMP
ncbi:MAG: hypothetical protein KZQ85_13425 [Candidatus Thiodiazotropha sp. (ex Myrtea sp. 'scaly one' KF741663)]|nr:hypothetical protein [Candidatus Thiodiazotropha sp. (ex Myrtea sp. 'scaly one' KF741663)]